jgi:uncharacterized membrane protein YgcG
MLDDEAASDRWLAWFRKPIVCTTTSSVVSTAAEKGHLHATRNAFHGGGSSGGSGGGGSRGHKGG